MPMVGVCAKGGLLVKSVDRKAREGFEVDLLLELALLPAHEPRDNRSNLCQKWRERGLCIP